MAKKPTTLHIKDLHTEKNVTRRHTPRNIGVIADSLHEVGAARSIVIDEDGHVLAGKGTVEAAAEVGITAVQVVESDGKRIIAVRRSGLSDREKQRLALADNRAQDLSAFDDDELRALDDATLAGLWTAEEIAALKAHAVAEAVEPMTVGRPVDVAWILVGIPLSEWPKHQAAVESLQAVALFTSMTMRPKGAAPDTDEKRPRRA